MVVTRLLRLLSIILAIFIVFVGYVFLYRSDFSHSPRARETGPFFVVMPHHGISNDKLQSFYTFIKKEHPNINKVMIISPNHFNAPGGFAKSLPKDSDLCFLKTCVKGKSMTDFIPKDSPSPLFWSASGSYFTREHGLGQHFSFIIDTFGPKTLVYPLVLDREKDMFSDTNRIFNKLAMNNSFFTSDMLVISSVDFSHNTDEIFARFHDAKSIETIRNGRNFSRTEVDCQNCIKLVSDLANSQGKSFFNLYARTSVDTITNINSKTQNTSHIFGEYLSENVKDEYSLDEMGASGNRVYGAFFGDTMFASKIGNRAAKNPQYLKEVFREFYQSNDQKNDGIDQYHTKLYGFDFVGLNLETVLSEGECKPIDPKAIKISSSPGSLDLLRERGFTVLNLANNHTQDCGGEYYSKAFSVIKEHSMDAFGGSHVLKKNYRGIDVAFIGINDFQKGNDYDKIKKIISNLKTEGNIVFISMHFGDEYSMAHSKRQETLAHSLVDAGADIIVGHHTHTIQDIEYYKNAPIIYGLGNFIFDQNDKDTLKGRGVIFSIGKDGVYLKTVDFLRNPNDFGIYFLDPK